MLINSHLAILTVFCQILINAYLVICKRSFGDVQNVVNDNKWSIFKIGKLVMMLNGHLAIWIIWKFSIYWYQFFYYPDYLVNFFLSLRVFQKNPFPPPIPLNSFSNNIILLPLPFSSFSPISRSRECPSETYKYKIVSLRSHEALPLGLYRGSFQVFLQGHF